jgi:AraC-like DNA-binding protein
MFDLNVYSTPLLFGFAQGWIYALLFLARAWWHERRSDALFGCLLIAMTFEIWEYMLGFGGVEVLWRELEFFPRTFGLLLPPLVWFYLKAQFNADFRFRRADLKHAAPFLIYAAYHTIVFAQGRTFVEAWKTNVHFPLGIDFVEIIAKFLLEIGYFYQSYRLYRQYRQWAPSQFSNIETVNFRWFRNFSVAFVAASITGWAMTLTDLWLDLDFWHDWWDELFTAGLIYYLCITGYAQTQPRSFVFEPASVESANETGAPKPEKITENELQQWRDQIGNLMSERKPWLDPELTLAELARQLRTNASVLSAVINRAFGKNFNDYVNEYRVEAVKMLLQDPKARHLSLLGIGLECGFNSKSTFNRAFRKSTGMAPSEFNGSPWETPF